MDVSASCRKPSLGLTSGAGGADEGFRREAETSINSMFFGVALE